MLSRQLDVQRIVNISVPSDDELQLWVEKALVDYKKDAEVVIRIIDIDEMKDLNKCYRLKDGVTNILSFPFELPEGIEGVYLLGDLAVCAEVLDQEAKIQNKTLKAHWAHIVIHGVLHLLGYDHIEEKDAKKMEAKEVILLKELNIDNPYEERNVND